MRGKLVVVGQERFSAFSATSWGLSLSLYWRPQPDNEPVTLFRLTPEGRIVVAALLAAREADT